MNILSILSAADAIQARPMRQIGEMKFSIRYRPAWSAGDMGRRVCADELTDGTVDAS